MTTMPGPASGGGLEFGASHGRVSFVLDEKNRDYARELARGAGGAILFAFPLMMTMEMWWLGFYIEPHRFIIFVLAGFALLLGISRFAGFREQDTWHDIVLDALSGFMLGCLTSAILLALFGVLQPEMPLREIVGKIALVAIPATIGALVARKQFGGDDEASHPEGQAAPYANELFLMLGGAVFVAFNVAPTDEIELISHMMTWWQSLLLAAFTVFVQHAIVYNVEFAGQEAWPQERRFLFVFFSYTIAGYGIALAVSLYVVWTFGRVDGASIHEIANMLVVLGFPAALGAATARLVI
ncbi:TIGR02587 family membrane protein [Terrihabitans sp. B22-R8]|uniref:TIGR02587 family membrane protein n=1 Tax=Terrihabitans sp. B22-R8 TaxID=3425128 RepID=UPI00403CEF13